FVLSGPVGTGKTHLLASTLRWVTAEMGVAAAYVEISLLYATIRRGFQEGKSGGEIIKPLSQVELLAIDELGKGRGSPFEMETLDELIARRYNAGRSRSSRRTIRSSRPRRARTAATSRRRISKRPRRSRRSSATASAIASTAGSARCATSSSSPRRRPTSVGRDGAELHYRNTCMHSGCVREPGDARRTRSARGAAVVWP